MLMGVVLGLSSLLLIVSSAMACRAGLGPINVGTLIVLPWGLIILLFDPINFAGPDLTTATQGTIALFFACVAGGLFFYTLTARSRAVRLVVPFGRPLPLLDPRVTRWHMSGVTLLVIFVVIQTVQQSATLAQFGGILGVLRGGGNSYGIQARLALLEQTSGSIQQNFTVGALILGTVNYITYLGVASVFTGAVLWVHGRRPLALLPVAISAVYSVVSLQRTTFIVVAILFVMATAQFRRICSVANLLTPRSSRSFKVAIISVGLFVVLYPLLVRNEGTQNSTGLLSLLQYSLSGVGGLNAFGSTSGQAAAGVLSAQHLLWGGNSLSGVVNVLARLGLPIEQAPDYFPFWTYTVGGKQVPVNVGTALLWLVNDFPAIVWAAAILLIVFGVSRMQDTCFWRKPELLPLVTYALAAASYSWFAPLTRDLRLMLIVGVATWAFQRSKILTSYGDPSKVSSFSASF